MELIKKKAVNGAGSGTGAPKNVFDIDVSLKDLEIKIIRDLITKSELEFKSDYEAIKALEIVRKMILEPTVISQEEHTDEVKKLWAVVRTEIEQAKDTKCDSQKKTE